MEEMAQVPWGWPLTGAAYRPEGWLGETARGGMGVFETTPMITGLAKGNPRGQKKLVTFSAESSWK